MRRMSPSRVPPNCASSAPHVHFQAQFTFQVSVLRFLFSAQIRQKSINLWGIGSFLLRGTQCRQMPPAPTRPFFDFENLRNRQRKTGHATCRGDRCPPKYRTPPPPKNTELRTLRFRQNIGFASTRNATLFFSGGPGGILYFGGHPSPMAAMRRNSRLN